LSTKPWSEKGCGSFSAQEIALRFDDREFRISRRIQRILLTRLGE
jgi:hypothetical protein